MYTDNKNINFSSFNYKYLFPITWINADINQNSVEELGIKFQEILSNIERGMSNIDVLSLKNVIISELLKNVREHAGENTKYGILAIGLLPTSVLSKNKNGRCLFYTSKIEENYTSWLINNNIDNFIEIYFGDTGIGIVSEPLKNAYKKKFKKKDNLNKEDVLKWAFDKWSSSKVEKNIRGTKGLYRINRIVNKYNGFFIVKTHELCGGFEKGGEFSFSVGF